jgi:FAD/FMN-containing dehydrogenase
MKHDIAGLMAALPDLRWVTDAALVRQRSRDFFWYSPVLKRQLNGVSADVVVEAQNEADVVRILAACHARRIPVTPRGAGTGNYGQAMPLFGGVVLDVSALDKLLWSKRRIALSSFNEAHRDHWWLCRWRFCGCGFLHVGILP